MLSRAFERTVQTREQSSPVPTANREFVDELTRWTFQEKMVIRVASHSHQLEATNQTQDVYTIRDMVRYTLALEEWDGKSWRPFQPTDVQFEAIMLDAFVRTTLQPTTNGKLEAVFKLPERFGVFKFQVDYYRRGYSYLHLVDMVPIRPPRYDQVERFIPAASPYYAAAFSMMAGLVVFMVLFLFHKEESAKVKQN